MLNYLGEERSGSKLEFMHNGDKMTQREFSKIYSKIPEPYKAELLAGIVYEPPPPSVQHGQSDSHLITLLGVYQLHTPGTQLANNSSVVLSDEDEVQPDSYLRILPEAGGRSSIWRRKLKGAPELVVEVSFTSRSIDLHLKKDRYAKFGVKEYIVLCVEPNLFHWYNLESGEKLPVDGNGIIRSQTFPGLWINTLALLNGDTKTAFETIMLGLQSPEHNTFAELLAGRMT
jgi:Uma2 family endonuclease